MPRQQMRANLCIKLFCFVLLACCALSSLYGVALAQDEEENNQLGEGRIWIPRVAFPRRDAVVQPGYQPSWDRALSVEYLNYAFYLSLAKGLEVTKKESDFYLRVGGRIYLDFVHYFEDKNDLGSDGLGLRNFQIDADGRFSEKWLYRLSIGGMANGGKFDGGGAYVDEDRKSTRLNSSH